MFVPPTTIRAMNNPSPRHATLPQSPEFLPNSAGDRTSPPLSHGVLMKDHHATGAAQYPLCQSPYTCSTVNPVSVKVSVISSKGLAKTQFAPGDHNLSGGEEDVMTLKAHSAITDTQT